MSQTRRAPVRHWARGPMLVTGLALLSGCSLLAPRPAPVAAPVVRAPAPPPKPQLPLPADNHKFVLEPGQTVVGSVQVTVATQQDTLLDIARRFNIGYNEIVHANPGVDIWIPKAGTKVVVPTQFVLPAAPHEGIVINVAALRLFYYPKHKPGEPQLLYTYPIGIGMDGWNTPQGVTRVVARRAHPDWRPSPQLRRDYERETGEKVPAVVPAGPDNPLGQYEFRLGWPSYLIHGTNRPYGIGLRSSHGCVRLYPEDIEKLFQMVPVGTPVRVVNQPFLFGWREGRLYLQAYPPLNDDKRDWAHRRHALLARLITPQFARQLHAQQQQIDWDGVAAVAAAPRGIPVPVSGPTASGGLDAVLAATPEVQNRIPIGADWDGADDPSAAAAKTPQQVLSDLAPDAGVAPAPASAPAHAQPTSAHTQSGD